MKKIIALVLMLSMLFSLLAVPMGALAQENDNNFTISQLLEASSEDESTESADNRVWFDLEGNSELFMLYDTKADSPYSTRTSRSDFTPGVDFGGYIVAPTGDKETDYATITGTSAMNMGCFPYTLNTPPATPKRYGRPDFNMYTNDNVWWEIEGVSYKVDVNSKVIKLYPGVDTSAISSSTLSDIQKTELIAKYDSLKEMTIDVKNQQYSKIGILTGIMCNVSKDITVTLVYEDATEETKTVNIAAPGASDDRTYKNGQIYLDKMNTNTSVQGNGSLGFAPYEIETEPTKVLDKIILKPVSYTDKVKRPIFTISSWGVPVEPEERKVNFPIGEATGANSELFIKSYGNTSEDAKDGVYFTGKPVDGEWVPGLDYNSCLGQNATDMKYYATGDFAKDRDGLYTASIDSKTVARIGAIVYDLDDDKIDTSTLATPDFTTKDDGSVVWTIGDVEYGVNPTDKAIQLMNNVVADDVEDAALRARYESLAGVELDVTDGNYSSIGFLVGGANTVNHKLMVTPVYKDGNKGNELSSDVFKSIAGGEKVNARAFNVSTSTSTGAWGNVVVYYKPITFTTGIDSTKVLDKVIIKSSGGHYPLTIISAWGIGNTVEETFEVKEAKVEGGAVKVAYTTTENKTVKVIVAEYTDDTETSFVGTQIFDATLTAGRTEYTKTVETSAARVKVFVWKDLKNFFPYK